MDFNLNDDRRKWVIFGIVVVLIFVVVGALFFLFNDTEEKPLVEDVKVETPSSESRPIDKQEVVEQTDVVSLSKVKVISVSDLSTVFIIKVQMGLGDNVKEVSVNADINTVFYNINRKEVISPNELKTGDTIMLYSSGNSTTGLLNAHLICVGEDTGFRYDVLKSIEGSKESGYICTLYNTEDTLKVDKNTKVVSGYINIDIPTMNAVSKGSKVLYKYNPDFEITSTGNVYTCTEIVVFAME